MDIQVQEAWIGLAGTILGGAGFKIIEHWLTAASRRDKTALEIREELREDVLSLRQELKEVETDLDNWRSKYYDLLEKFIEVKTNLEVALKQIQEEHEQQLKETHDS
jgi:hypothetical protein